jgi:glyoxylase-like metal-dependent hydrolase (beta-lactamase superfamily II)
LNTVRPLHFCDVSVEGERWPVFGWAVEGPAGTVLVDTGMIDSTPSLDERWRPVLHPWPELGDVAAVINTHLHFDHCGWNTTLHADGSVTPTFPNARYFAHRGEVEHGRLQLDRDRVSYLAPNYEPLIESGQMRLLDTDGIRADPAICPGISVELFPGHTAHLMAVHIESKSAGGAVQHACYISDLIPTSAHLDPTWVMGYDLDPVECIAQRKRFYQRAIPEGWLVLFTHDHERPMARVGLNEKGRPVVL